MNDYIVLDGKRYKATFKEWKPSSAKSTTVRKLLSGATDVTIGAGVLDRFEMMIIAQSTPETNYGSPADLKATFDKTIAVSFTEPDTTVHNVVIVNPWEPTWLHPKTDAASNKAFVPAMMVKV